MTRRELGKLAAAGSFALLPAARAGAQAGYSGALEGFEGKVDAAAFDPVLYTRKLYESAPLRLTFRAQNRKQAEAWQKRLRSKIAALLGGFPTTRAARDFPAYRREKVVFESRPGLLVLGYLLTPRATAPPHPVMICLPGHG